MPQHNPATTDPAEILLATATTREELAEKLGLKDLSAQDVTREVLEEMSQRVIYNQILNLHKELTPQLGRELALKLLEDSVHEITGDVQGVHITKNLVDHDAGGLH